jgi:hypothetical protein
LGFDGGDNELVTNMKEFCLAEGIKIIEPEKGPFRLVSDSNA